MAARWGAWPKADALMSHVPQSVHLALSAGCVRVCVTARRQKFIKAMIVIYSNGISVCNARANGWPKGYATHRRQPRKMLAKKNILPPKPLLLLLLHCEVVMAMSSIRFD